LGHLQVKDAKAKAARLLEALSLLLEYCAPMAYNTNEYNIESNA